MLHSFFLFFSPFLSSQTLFFITSDLLFKLSLAFIDFSPNALPNIFEPIRHDSIEHGGACNAEQNNIKYLYKGKKKRGGVKGEGKTAVCMLQFHWFPSLLSVSPCIGCVWTERDRQLQRAETVMTWWLHETVSPVVGELVLD